MAGSSGTLLSRSLSLSSCSCCFSLLPRSFSLIFLSQTPRRGFHTTLCLSTTASTPTSNETLKHSLLLDRLRSRHIKESPKPLKIQIKTNPNPSNLVSSNVIDAEGKNKEKLELNEGFEELGLSEEVLGAVKEMGIENPTEIQCIGIPAVLEGKSVVLGSHTGSGKTLAYMLPLVQMLRRDEELYGMLMKPRRPRAVVLCPTRELSEQVFRVAKSISHHARFRSTRISGGGRSRPQEDSLNVPVDMVVGTPGRVLQHIEEGNMVYGDIKYLVLDEADTMFDRGFGPDIRKFLAPLKKRQEKPGDQGFQTVLVTATMTKAVEKLVDDEFQGILHLRTSSLHKKIASARHDFIRLSSSENKLESLLQVLEPSLAKGNRVMVFCNTLNSSRAVDHFLRENQMHTVNYHGEVPAVERVENLKKFKSEEGDCPTLVCTDLAARGLDLAVDHVIMFDFPSNSIDYLHRTGRTARMGAKGKVTSLVTKKDLLLATRIEESIKKNESLESLNASNVKRDSIQLRENDKKGRPSDILKMKNKNIRNKSAVISKSSKVIKKYSQTSSLKAAANKTGRGSAHDKAGKKVFTFSKSKPVKSYGSSIKRDSLKGKKSDAVRSTSSLKAVPNKTGRGSAHDKAGKKVFTFSKSKPVKSYGSSIKRDSLKSKKSDAVRSTASKLRVVGFRGRSSSGEKNY